LPLTTAVSREQGGDEVRLRHLQLIAAKQLAQGRQRDAGKHADDRQHHDLLDQAEAQLIAASGSFSAW
jgi:hypothetical protein